MLCDKCGQKISEGTEYCDGCGSRVEQSFDKKTADFDNPDIEIFNADSEAGKKAYNSGNKTSSRNHRKNKKKSRKNKNNFKLALASHITHNKKFMKKVLLAGFLLLLLIVLIRNSTIKVLEIRYYGLTKDNQKLLEYVTDNYTNKKAKAPVGAAISEIAAHKYQKGIDFLKEKIFDNETAPDYIRYDILHSFNKNKILLSNVQEVSDYYIENYNDKNVSDDLKNALISQLRLYPEKDVEEAFYEHIYSLYKENEVGEALELTDNYKSVDLGSSVMIDNINVPLEELVTYLYNGSSSGVSANEIAEIIKKHTNSEIDAEIFKEIKKLYSTGDLQNCIKLADAYINQSLGTNEVFTRIDEAVKTKQKNLSRISEIDNEISGNDSSTLSTNSLKDRENVLKRQLEAYENQTGQAANSQQSVYITLRFYVVDKIDFGKYEIAFAKYSDSGTTRASYRAVLETNGAFLHTKQWGTREIRYMGTEETKLSDNDPVKQYDEYQMLDSSAGAGTGNLNGGTDAVKNIITQMNQAISKLDGEINGIPDSNESDSNNSFSQLKQEKNKLLNENANIDWQMRQFSLTSTQ